MKRGMQEAMTIGFALMDATATTTIRRSGNPVMPDSLNAMTNGEAPTPELPKIWDCRQKLAP